MTLRLSTDAPVSRIAVGPCVCAHARTQLFAGRRRDALVDSIADTARHFEQETTAYWRSWSRALAIPLEWRDA